MIPPLLEGKKQLKEVGGRGRAATIRKEKKRQKDLIGREKNHKLNAGTLIFISIKRVAATSLGLLSSSRGKGTEGKEKPGKRGG